jgi:hypothetical protein
MVFVARGGLSSVRASISWCSGTGTGAAFRCIAGSGTDLVLSVHAQCGGRFLNLSLAVHFGMHGANADACGTFCARDRVCFPAMAYGGKRFMYPESLPVRFINNSCFITSGAVLIHNLDC